MVLAATMANRSHGPGGAYDMAKSLEADTMSRTKRGFALAKMRVASVLILAPFIAAEQVEAVSPPPVQAENGMVVTAQHLASEVGAEILKGGGNAVDAAVAVGYALAVVLPCCGNIGGGGFATLHLADGRDLFINFREKAPGAATETMYLDAVGEIVPDLSLRGYKAVAVPGSVLGLDTMLAKYGTMTRDKVMAPAIRLARGRFRPHSGRRRYSG